MRSTAEVLDHHMKCFAGRDLDALLADYSADAMFFGPEGALRGGRSAQNFVIEVVVTRGNENRRAISRGRDSYAVTAPLACEAVARLLKGKSPAGAHAPGEIFDAKDFLEALGPDHSMFEIVTN